METLVQLFDALKLDSAAAEKGNKAASIRFRNGTVAIEKQCKLLRAESLAASKAAAAAAAK